MRRPRELLWADVIALNEHIITVFDGRDIVSWVRRFVRQELAHPVTQDVDSGKVGECTLYVSENDRNGG